MITQDYPKEKMVAIPLRYVPFYETFRYDKKWWYNVPPDEIDGENAVATNVFVLQDALVIPLEKIVGLHINDLPKSLAHYSKMLY